MKKSLFVYLILAVIILLIGILAFSFLIDKREFDYQEAEEEANYYLEKNEKQLMELVSELYVTKSSKKDSIKGVTYASYVNRDDFDFKNSIEYIKIDLHSQGMLGGQYYGLLYTKEKVEDYILFDEKKESKNGNNVFIRKKIKDNWYFYYDDYDGKVSIKK